MKNIIITTLLLCVAVMAFAQGNYYNAVIDLTGQQLYTALHSLISTNTITSYDDAKEFIFQELDNTNGNVTCIYTGEVYNVGYNYTGSTNPNTEHTYAQSWFSSPDTSKKKADVHHLFPTNMVVNSSRGNYPLFTVANHASANVYYNDTPWQSYRGQSSTGYTVFEPCDETKGNIARALLYFNTRYYDSLTQQNINMIPVLVQWNTFDPPDATEIARNNAIYGFTTNRNPFVDHPEFVNRIWGTTAVDDETVPALAELSISRVYPNPFRASAVLTLQSKDAARADVAVFNTRGQQVRSWTQRLEKGETLVTWDGKDDASQKLPAGIYMVKISSGNRSVSARLMLN